MFCSWVVVFIFQLVRFTISRDIELQSSTGATSELSNKRDPPRSKFEMFDLKKFGSDPQVVEDTFNTKSWGFGTTERKMLMDIKTRVDSLSAPCKGMSTFWVEYIFWAIKTFITIVVPGAASECPNGWVPFVDSCYLVIDIPTLKWSDARRTCQNLGGDLAVVKAFVENKFIFELMKRQRTVTYLGVWLGLHRAADDKFYWVDGTPAEAWEYSAWANDDPHSVTEKCAHMYGNGNKQGKWSDIVCDLNQQALSYSPVVLCQKKAH